MKLQVGMQVRIKNNPKDYLFEANNVKTITKHQSNFGKHRAFGLDGDDNIWLIEDFAENINYPQLSME